MSKLTINEIAERAGVSKTTVSFFLNGKTHKMSEDTQQRIQRIIDETGYEPSAAARAMKSKSTGLIGVILGDISDPYCAKALKGMEDAASARDFQILPGSSEMLFKSEQEYVERMMRMGVEGFIIQATYRFGMLAQDLEKKRKPIVYLGSRPYEYTGRYVKENNYESVYKVITDCVKKGYETFIIIFNEESDFGIGFETSRGFRDALQDSGMDGNTIYLNPDTKSEEVYEVLSESVDLNKKTLIFVVSPHTLKVVYQAIRQFPNYIELFSDRLGLIGFDPEGWTQLATPPVSAIITPAYEEGVRVMEEMLQVLDGKKKETEVVFKNIVKYRGTTL
ncbi:LacI family DNA-binding transcriptional regulator [Lachnoclostridium sp. An76]|uniref:LacI family DNA-binding transcriptional regulator n=1 Tax=Lachnoclostridium sp. An76 TaxID=1965654 RepID=UPI000B3717C9|nr:LacI family DNA-binding transcriptional regulator [Lachnoclostridium sp. An76]OUN34660.1 LacI family transcriptional regulator [Lachnoclostridium sp. An76]